jgi:hypothetical protein
MRSAFLASFLRVLEQTLKEFEKYEISYLALCCMNIKIWYRQNLPAEVMTPISDHTDFDTSRPGETCRRTPTRPKSFRATFPRFAPEKGLARVSESSSFETGSTSLKVRVTGLPSSSVLIHDTFLPGLKEIVWA